ncbi:MAG: septum site-determining protein MinC [Gammaproteobacteria bacterium]
MQRSQQDVRQAGGAEKDALDIKGSVFTLSVLCLKSNDIDAMARALGARLAQAPRFFQNAPVVIDVKAVRDTGLDFHALVRLLRDNQLVPVGVRHATPEQLEVAISAGLAVMQGGSKPESVDAASVSHSPQPQPSIQQAPVPEVAVAKPVAHSPQAVAARIVRQPVRSGQQIYARGGDLVLLAPVNAGAEVLADGNIHVYAPLRGRALAGVNGDTNARVFTQSLEAELVSVAGHYRIFEQQPAADVFGKPVQVYLDGERLIIAPLI